MKAILPNKPPKNSRPLPDLLLVGIDIGSKELVTARADTEGKMHLRTFANDLAGQRAFLAHCRSLIATKGTVRVALEATGTYGLELSLLLARTEGFAVMVVNPKIIKAFLRGRGVRGKTDAIDAVGILNYLQTSAFRSWQAPADHLLALQGIGRRIYQLNAEKIRENNRLEAVEHQGKAGKLVAADLKKSIQQIETRIGTLEKAGMELVKEHPALGRAFELITSVRGIAARSALRLLGELLLLPSDMKGPQWVAQAGLDPRVRQSGTSLDGHRYISKAGNRYIRAALFMPALVAANKEPAVVAHYQHLIKDLGKEKMVALCAIMRKLLLSIYGMLKTSTPFNPTRFTKLTLNN